MTLSRSCCMPQTASRTVAGASMALPALGTAESVNVVLRESAHLEIGSTLSDLVDTTIDVREGSVLDIKHFAPAS